MDTIEPRMRWWGWGEDGHDGPVKPGAKKMLAATCGWPASVNLPPVELADVQLPEAELSADARVRFEALLGAEYVRDDHATRVSHSAGRSVPDLLRLRSGEVPFAPDAVLYPASEMEVDELLTICQDERIAVVPFGGGTSVVAGIDAFRQDFSSCVCISLARLDEILDIDEESLTATVQAGVFGPDLEKKLQAKGLTLGHFPQSFEFSTVGGWVATRSAGQQSTGYGRIDENVFGLRASTPSGRITLRSTPATAAGPNPRQLLVGSEGTLGIITQATLRIKRVPEVALPDAWFFPDFHSGATALREIEQSGVRPDIARLSDLNETEFGLAQLGSDIQRKGLLAYLRARGVTTPCMLVLRYDGRKSEARSRRAAGRAIARKNKGVTMGGSPETAWEKHRFSTPYLRDQLMTDGVMVETMETAAPWSRIESLHDTIKQDIEKSLADRGTPALVLCHISHLYSAGCSLYYTVFAKRQQGQEMEQWKAVKTAAGNAMVNNGGTITHHHATGADHAPWLPQETGELWVRMLRAAKAEVDPEGIMNPGKLMNGPEAL
ncbi:MAG: FAD-binding oxidoreductase [Brevibacterium aurantiacum]|uniref:Alkyldihydroxyacetonephosphate synthase n=2 Tax=Brevibacterium aurantiacum TaxID=273384 RepID=A0A1D7VYP8_BREAU|nr:FAD-binding oxidoreductase [Brevibacterium aurantiacum]MDN5549531.1 FAD-binding oxidoreductase [Brevibacterium sp.]AOP51860.1 Alkyldihydroxyacetonephosphate synthase [Brevibacterium aurantiacum]MDN5593804.1 FAD-binding oxidoreductase [Brevibacterium sp.]MDN5607449.1 FAD-binding oxidoreductase [Brevibacterium sp.]MDN5710977.1 FAD-binding oxidoreductase [Brevibacterium aurantiacum]